MKLNDLRAAPGARREAVRVGRGIGSTLGKTCGRGHKGSYARAGKGKIKPGFEGGQMPLQRRLPKVGFRSMIKATVGEVYLYQIAGLGLDTVDLLSLRAAKLISDEVRSVKVVNKGSLDRAVKLVGLRPTAGARAVVEAAGGQIVESVSAESKE
jgi:large subunit ribosomal protein L15